MGTEQSASARNTFVGRERELAELVSACEAGADSDAHLFLLYGEPGIGKTRLADELASRAKAKGLQVLWGRCWEGDGAPAYWPWIQVIRSFLGALDPERRRNLATESEIASDIIDEMAKLIPDLRPEPSFSCPPVTDKLEPDEARFRLLDAVTNFLKTGARSHPLLIVLDDLHDADEASLAMLRFMVRELKGAEISIVATYREAEVRRSPSLSKLVGELSREGHSIPIGGLSESEVTKLFQVRAGRTPDETLVSRLCAATDGNPLFVDGIVRTLIAEGAIGSAGALERPFKIPHDVREAIRGRLDSLSPASHAILQTAAAIGNEFGSNLCQSIADVSADEGHRHLDEASSAGIVAALGRGRYRFSHALIRGVVYDELDTSGRVLLHGKIANRLEEIYREDIDPHLAELAHHFREAGVAEKAIDYSVRAGQAAASVVAFTDAMVHWQAALELMEEQGSDARRRAELLSLLGDVAFEIDQAKSVQYRESAIALYERNGWFDKAALIHIRLGNSFSMQGVPLVNGSHMRVGTSFARQGLSLVNGALANEHFRRAESVLTGGPETISLAWLYVGIAVNESRRMDLVRSTAAARRAMGISDRLGDKVIWANAAAAYAWCLLMSGQLKEGFVLYGQAFDAALAAKSSGLAMAWPAGWYCVCLGDPPGARGWFERELSRPRNERAPFGHQLLSFLSDNSYFEQGQLREIRRRLGSEHWAIRFWVDGEWEAVKALEETVAEAFERTDDRSARFNWSVPLGEAYLLLGEYARAEAHLLYGLDNRNRGPVVLQEMRVRPLLTHVYLAMNQLDAAAQQVARCHRIIADGEDWRGLAGDVALAKAVVGAARGNYDIAERQFESALAIHRKYRGAWEEADTLQYWGRALAAAGDRIRATEKFDAAIENHRSRGVGPRFIEWLTGDKMRALGPTPRQTEVGGANQTQQAESKVTGAFRREGEFWTISYPDNTFRLKDAKGLRYIAYLLGRPGRRTHVYDLIEAVEGSIVNERSTIHAESENLEIVREIGGPAPTVDFRARSGYRTRLHDLRAELDEAERMNDLGRSERLSTEIEMIGEELTGSLGLGGRPRMSSRSEERARGLVGKNIRSMVEKIRHEHPALGRHFGTAISTGNFCVYQPDPDHPVSWQL